MRLSKRNELHKLFGIQRRLKKTFNLLVAAHGCNFAPSKRLRIAIDRHHTAVSSKAAVISPPASIVLQTVVNASAKALVNEYWWHYGRISTWNSQMSRLEIVETVMIARETAADQASQHISRRDFVSVCSRHEVLDTDRMVEDYYMCYISTEFPGAPPEGEYVRGAYHPSGFRFSPNGDSSTKFQFVLNVDLKIHALLKPFIRVFMIPSMVEYANCLRNYAPMLKKT
ncbi:unnamed protein product [Darwinula stevensoni]|uniref:START domain-containing protein n=1 Tax=Darwinula stevensoni TaxID=69355 RepID=A0A7R8XDU7_9CRUS|nr:unnamed protein product [Darwinula stevensoni]CAG0893419.1 unnamed protein product [Darwinula stevensoni]